MSVVPAHITAIASGGRRVFDADEALQYVAICRIVEALEKDPYDDSGALPIIARQCLALMTPGSPKRCGLQSFLDLGSPIPPLRAVS